MTAGALEMRDGRFWCLRHQTWWRQCPCPGEVSMSVPIDQAAIEATTPKRGAFREAVER